MVKSPFSCSAEVIVLSMSASALASVINTTRLGTSGLSPADGVSKEVRTVSRPAEVLADLALVFILEVNISRNVALLLDKETILMNPFGKKTNSGTAFQNL